MGEGGQARFFQCQAACGGQQAGRHLDRHDLGHKHGM